MLHTNEKEPRRDLYTLQQERFLISNSSFALAVVFLLEKPPIRPKSRALLSREVIEVGIIRIEDVVIQLMIDTPDVV